MSDDAKRKRKIQTLLKEALDLPADTQAEFVARATGDDTELAAEVMALLAFDGEKTGGLSASIRAVAGDLRHVEAASYTGEQVGSYRITEKLAEGGMGSVYIGQHVADDFDQTVAIKLLPRHRLSEDAHRRFVDERRIQAGLQHPNIAQLIDGGTMADGVPYIIMEFIDGLTIDEHCKQNALDADEVIALIRRVCDALQYAHRKLVIHRDIKPSNIIVTAEGVPKLLDFGIAKLLDENIDQAATSIGQRVLTPMYASPEQLEGAPITTAADVYGVGLLLYRLLTRQMPYVPTGATPRDIESAILSQDPQRPSQAVQTRESTDTDTDTWSRRQHKALRGDLDTILLTALQKQPERRYESVAAFDADLGRYLANRPISARPDSPLYVFSKFMRRHRIAAASAAMVLVGAISLVSYYTDQLRIERDVATQTAEFLSDLFRARDPYQRNKNGLTVSALVDDGLEKLEKNKDLSPEVEVRLLSTISQVKRNLGELDVSSSLAEKALSIAENHAGEVSALVIPPLTNLVAVRRLQDEHQEAMGLAERMLSVSEKTKGKKSREVAQATHLLSIEAYRLGDLDAMGEWAQRTYNLRRELYGENDPARSVGATALGLYYWQTDDPVKARGFYEESAAILAAQPERNLMTEASLLHNIGLLYNDSGDYAGAVERYQQSVELRRRAGNPNDPIMPMTLYSLAHSQSQLGDKVAAHQTFLQQLPLQVAVAGREKHFVAYALTGHGMLLEEMGDMASAKMLLEEADRIYALQDDPLHVDRAAAWLGLARIENSAQNWPAAKRLTKKAVDLRREKNGPENDSTLRARIAMARSSFLSNDLGAARVSIDDVLKIFANSDTPDHPYVAEAMTLRARIALASGEANMAVEFFEEANEQLASRFPSTHHLRAEVALQTADAYAALGAADQANDLRRRWAPIMAEARSSWLKVLEENPVPVIDTYLGTEDNET